MYSSITVSKVSVPYEITLLSNTDPTGSGFKFVSVPYEITLLSNECMKLWKNSLVSVPYEITLLSNSYLDKVR